MSNVGPVPTGRRNQSSDRGRGSDRGVRLSTRTPLPPNRTCGSPAYGSPVGGLPARGLTDQKSGNEAVLAPHLGNSLSTCSFCPVADWNRERDPQSNDGYDGDVRSSVFPSQLREKDMTVVAVDLPSTDARNRIVNWVCQRPIQSDPGESPRAKRPSIPESALANRSTRHCDSARPPIHNLRS